MEQRIRIARTGGPEVMQLESFEPEAPGPGEALVRHTLLGVNYIDTYHRSGLYPLALPASLGVEAAGVIERLGPDTAALGLREGDRVAYVTQAPGSYATARVVPAERLVPLPPTISDELAAASMLKGMTVEFLVRRVYPVRAGDPVLLHAAAGGVGLLACQWLKALGARVIGTVGSEQKAELIRQHGAEHAIVYTREDFARRVRELFPEGVPVVYDSVGKATLEGSLDCLAVRGMLVSFGNASGKPPPIDLLALSAKGSLFVTRPTLFAYTRTRAELLESAVAVFAMLASGLIAPQIAERLPLFEARKAHERLEARERIGQLLLVP
jgi:NADPH2:quinone reductase